MSNKSLLPYVQTKVVWSDMELVTTRRLQICEHREQQIWEKQSGELFRSDCAILKIHPVYNLDDSFYLFDGGAYFLYN